MSFRTSPHNLEKIARFPAGEKCTEPCHACGCHGFLNRSRKSFSGEGTLKDSSFPVSLKLWDMLVLCTPPPFHFSQEGDGDLADTLVVMPLLSVATHGQAGPI